MVQVSNKYPLTDDGYIDFELWFPLLESFYPKERLQTIVGALDLLTKIGVDEPSAQGGSCFRYGIEMAAVLFDLQADEEAIAASMLFELYQNDKLLPEQVTESCGVAVQRILDGTKKMSALRMLQNQSPSQAQFDNFRKMLLTIVEDVRIVLVKLADRVCVLRLSQNWTEHYKKLAAKEILDIYAPLANRLGLSKIKWELEDRAFYFLYPVEYKKIAKALKRKRLEREQYIQETIAELSDKLKSAGLTASVDGRVKHIYSIWRKISKKNRDIDTLYDIRALRVLVDSVDDCYTALSVVNDLWEPIPSEFADYIANPKPNGYQSVHTIVWGPQDLTVEVQIRTHAMHEESEMGVAAHWRYKEGVRHDPSYEAKVVWLRSLLDWESQLASESGSSAAVQALSDNRVYAFTPSGDVIDIESGGTVLDFAYMVHTMVGHRTKGAKVNGRIVPLTTKLKTGDRVEIMTHKQPQPSIDWANANLGYINSAKIRARVVRWFKQENKEQNAILGRDKLLEALKTHRLKTVDYGEVADHFNMADEETLYSSIATSALKTNSVVNYICDKYAVIEKNTHDQAVFELSSNKAQLRPKKSDLTVYGIDNLLSHVAGCCKPVRGDMIIGYLTHGRGVTVHRQGCANFMHLQHQHPDRVIDVQWGSKDTQKYLVDVSFYAHAVQIALQEVMSILTAEKIEIMKLDKPSSAENARINLRLALTNADEIEKLLNKFAALKHVEDVKRV